MYYVPSPLIGDIYNTLLTRSLTPELIEWWRLEIQQQTLQHWGGKLPEAQLGNGGGQPSVLLGVNTK